MPGNDRGSNPTSFREWNDPLTGQHIVEANGYDRDNVFHSHRGTSHSEANETWQAKANPDGDDDDD